MKAFTLFLAGLVIVVVGVTAFSGPSISSNEKVTTETFLPEPTNFVVDVPNVLTPEQENELNTTLKNQNHEVAVAIVDTTSPLEIEQYGIKIADKWKVGDKDKDNGAIIIIAVKDRKVRIEVGQGLEGDIPDAVAGRIISENMMPFLKQGDWYGAVKAAIEAINNKIK